jgi:hypothetical protein
MNLLDRSMARTHDGMQMNHIWSMDGISSKLDATAGQPPSQPGCCTYVYHLELGLEAQRGRLVGALRQLPYTTVQGVEDGGALVGKALWR